MVQQNVILIVKLTIKFTFDQSMRGQFKRDAVLAILNTHSKIDLSFYLEFSEPKKVCLLQ